MNNHQASFRTSHFFFLVLLLFIVLFNLGACASMPSDTFSETSKDDLASEGYSELNEKPAEPESGSTEPESVQVLPYIGLYGGTGSWDINVEAFGNFFEHYGYQWSVINEEDLQGADLAELYDLIWFPGGFAAEYKYAAINHDSLVQFVNDGGMFIGSCAGAYYASAILSWYGDDFSYPLQLFPGKAVGPLSGQIGWGEIAELDLSEEFQFNSSFLAPLPVYYFDGPYFEPFEDNHSENELYDEFTVLARYSINNQPAVVAGRNNQGKHLLFGPHPEIGGYSASDPSFNLTGGEGAQWEWLQNLLTWFIQW